MKKAGLIQELSGVLKLPRTECELIVETIFGGIARSVRQGDKVEIRGFGSFRTRQRRARIGRNPKSGARVKVPAKAVPYFKAGKELIAAIQNSAAMPVVTPGTETK